jgi:methylmalonyl-CoA mutase C-terminal domain/subunit
VALAGDPARVVLGKLGLDGHDRGVRMLARELRDRGCEVILLGSGMSAEMIAGVARDEDADVVGISILSGAHLTLLPRLLEAMKTMDVAVPVVCGGVISAADADKLTAAGVAAVCGVGTTVPEAAQVVVDVAAAAGRTRV